MARAQSDASVADWAMVAVHADTAAMMRPTIAAERSALAPNASAVDARGRAYTEVDAVNLRLWMGAGRGAQGVQVGLGAGVAGYAARDATRDPARWNTPDAAPASPLLPTASLGMRSRLDGRSVLYADASSGRRMTADGSADGVTTRVGMEWKAKSDIRAGWLRQGALSMQLDSGYRIAVRPRGGGLSLQLRGQF